MDYLKSRALEIIMILIVVGIPLITFGYKQSEKIAKHSIRIEYIEQSIKNKDKTIEDIRKDQILIRVSVSKILEYIENEKHGN